MNRLRRWRGTWALFGGLAVGWASSPAWANGRYPLATQLVAAPNDPSYLSLRATFGILGTRDSGKSWTWICEQAAGYSDIQDPSMAIGADGTLIVAAENLRISPDRGCSWSSPVALPSTEVTDLDVDRARPERIVALTAASDGMGSVVDRVLESIDNGRTWAPIGTPISDGLIATTIEVAPPARIYLSGRFGPTQGGGLERSDDGGATWRRLPIDVLGSSFPFIGAVDPADPDRVYVRSSGGDSDGVFVTTDGGATWTRIFSATGGLLGFALAPDGQSIAVGGPATGLNVASTSDYQFQKVSTIGAYCLRWTGAGLYACAKELGDGFTLGLSSDRGATFATLLQLPSVVPLACPPQSSTGSTCGPYWGAVATVIGADAGPDASKGVPDPSSNPVTEAPPSSCHCTFARRKESQSSTVLMCVVLGSMLAGQRRLRRATQGGES